jgi:transketolase
MRKAFIETLIELALDDERILLLTADLGFMALEPFAENFPKRFFNVGVAEQNMVGLATGLAEAGYIPFIYSITPFAVLRPYEFIRNGPIYHQFPVRIIGIGGGLEYGHDGISHYGIDDIGVLRVQPGITIITPADYKQATAALSATWDLPGPVYYRLSKDDKSIIKEINGHFELGRAQIIDKGKDVLIITMGSIATEVVKAAEILKKKGIFCTIMVISCISPPPISDILDTLKQFSFAITVEAHYIIGGLGSFVSEVTAEHGLNCAIVRLGIKNKPDGFTGSQSYIYHLYGLTAEGIAETAIREMGKHNTLSIRSQSVDIND